MMLWKIFQKFIHCITATCGNVWEWLSLGYLRLAVFRKKKHFDHKDSNKIRTQNNLVCKRTLNHLAKLAKWLSCVAIHRTDKYSKWLSVRLQTKWLWVRILLLSLKLQIWRLLLARSSLTFRQCVFECVFTLKFIRDRIITHSHFDHHFQFSNNPKIRLFDEC